MYSPFYTAEQKRLYPYRNVTIRTKEEAANFFTGLIKNRIETKENLSVTPIGEIKFKYLVNCDSISIYEALQLI